jgi:hypothetical protein
MRGEQNVSEGGCGLPCTCKYATGETFLLASVCSLLLPVVIVPNWEVFWPINSLFLQHKVVGFDFAFSK